MAAHLRIRRVRRRRRGEYPLHLPQHHIVQVRLSALEIGVTAIKMHRIHRALIPVQILIVGQSLGDQPILAQLLSGGTVIVFGGLHHLLSRGCRAAALRPVIRQRLAAVGGLPLFAGLFVLLFLLERNPLVIVDESHHARSDLSREMLANFNPCFVLDLTATPRKDSNIISYVDAVQLKTEHMVKLPVIVYNRDSQAEVILDAIALRNKLEELAAAEYAVSKKYIRPIVLFQAEPKGKEEATTFEKIREKLIGYDIPAEQIAIRTADVNELKNTELMSADCPIRYIITVNALSEGWDCPLAYILASIANKTSQVQVEQILGRILRLPHTTQHRQSSLNMSYVLTSSNDFNETVKGIIQGLNDAGFSDKDYRVSEPPTPKAPDPVQIMIDNGCSKMETPLESPEEDVSGVDWKLVNEEYQRRREAEKSPETTPKADSMLSEAESAG